jgi:hypothetical protein
MNKKIIIIVLSVVAGSLILLPLQNGESQKYIGHDGSISEYLTKIKVQQYKKNSPYWSYIVMACAENHSIAVAGVDLKSDVEKVSLGVNKIIPKGQCSVYGAVMKANDGSTLGATLITKDDAIKEAQGIIDKIPVTQQKGPLMKRLMEIYNMIGFIPRF